MSHNELEEISGTSGRKSTTRLLRSLHQVLKESGAEKFLQHGRTMPPGHSAPRTIDAAAVPDDDRTLPPGVAAAQPVAEEPRTRILPRRPELPAGSPLPRAQLERPVCLSSPRRKGLLRRLFG